MGSLDGAIELVTRRPCRKRALTRVVDRTSPRPATRRSGARPRLAMHRRASMYAMFSILSMRSPWTFFRRM